MNCQTKGLLVVCKLYWKTVNVSLHFIHRQCGVWTVSHQVVNTVFSSRKRHAHSKYLDSKLKKGSRTLQRFQVDGRHKRIKGEIKCSNGTERIQQKIHFEPKANRKPRDIYISKFHCEFRAQIIEEHTFSVFM